MHKPAKILKVLALRSPEKMEIEAGVGGEFANSHTIPWIRWNDSLELLWVWVPRAPKLCRTVHTSNTCLRLGCFFDCLWWFWLIQSLAVVTAAGDIRASQVSRHFAPMSLYPFRRGERVALAWHLHYDDGGCNDHESGGFGKFQQKMVMPPFVLSISKSDTHYVPIWFLLCTLRYSLWAL